MNKLTMYILCLIVLYLSMETVLSDEVWSGVDPETLWKVAKDIDDTRWYDPQSEWGVYYEFDKWAKNRYKVIGHTKDGVECIDNCVDGTCITGWDYNVRKPCNVTSGKTPPVYFTSKSQPNMPVCLTRCAKLGEKYEWCLIDGRHNWDYCSSEIYTSKQQVQLTDKGPRCETPCIPNTKGEYLCTNALKKSAKCNPKVIVDFIQARNVYGELCSSPCYKQKKGFRWGDKYGCYNSKEEFEYCAPPAQIFESAIKNMYMDLHLPYESSDFRYEIPYTR